MTGPNKSTTSSGILFGEESQDVDDDATVHFEAPAPARAPAPAPAPALADGTGEGTSAPSDYELQMLKPAVDYLTPKCCGGEGVAGEFGRGCHTGANGIWLCYCVVPPQGNMQLQFALLQDVYKYKLHLSAKNCVTTDWSQFSRFLSRTSRTFSKYRHQDSDNLRKKMNTRIMATAKKHQLTPETGGFDYLKACHPLDTLSNRIYRERSTRAKAAEMNQATTDKMKAAQLYYEGSILGTSGKAGAAAGSGTVAAAAAAERAIAAAVVERTVAHAAAAAAPDRHPTYNIPDRRNASRGEDGDPMEVDIDQGYTEGVLSDEEGQHRGYKTTTDPVTGVVTLKTKGKPQNGVILLGADGAPPPSTIPQPRKGSTARPRDTAYAMIQTNAAIQGRKLALQEREMLLREQEMAEKRAEREQSKLAHAGLMAFESKERKELRKNIAQELQLFSQLTW
ncbi:hypothetical protein B484DRAFT_433795 [Ochromonadaceae sp. CCMP2298]|nr:hypothetical protein B484DRAFT_433795 [Ochromonadaceae sp. CCMP2298]